MLNKIIEIYSGWYALLFKERTPLIDNRLNTCKKCFNRNKVMNTCKHCGCYIPALCFYKHSKCDEWNEKNSKMPKV